MLAHMQGGSLNQANLARGLGIDGKTVSRYLDLLVDLLLVRRLAPFRANVGKRLVKSPKIYVRDSGIVHALLGLEDREAVLGIRRGGIGGFVVETLLGARRAGEGLVFRRGRCRVDLLLNPTRKTVAIE